MKILAFPRDRNPYQELLYAEIRRLGQPWIRSLKRRSRAMVTLLSQIAKRSGVGKVNISLILRNKSWRTGEIRLTRRQSWIREA